MLPNDKNYIVLLSGYLKSGKDTVGEYLCQTYGFKRYAFADILKDEVSNIYNLDRTSLDTQEGKSEFYHYGESSDENADKKITVREILINHGQMRRSENIDYWVKRVWIQICQDKCRRVVITDWRFPNEYTYIACRKPVIGLRINRWPSPLLNDSTETALDNFRFHGIINNTTTVADLYRNVDYQAILKGFCKVLLTDVDEVLLQWCKGFSMFMLNKGYKTKQKLPKYWDLKNWLDPNLTQEEIQKLINDFNSSAEFGKLKPYNGARETLEIIRSKGYAIVAISSCSDSKEIIALRECNLEAHYPNLIDVVICLPLDASKREILSQFSKSVWIDDQPHNVLAGMQVGHDSYIMDRPWNTGGNFKRIHRFNELGNFLK